MTGLPLLESPKRLFLILYGSETGNALELADWLAARLNRFSNAEAHSMSMNEYKDPQKLAAKADKYYLVVFICSTTGQGELPKNTHVFWRALLLKKLASDMFEKLKFTTFGLGDSSYPRYQWAIQKLHKRLLQLGAREFGSRGEGDEQSTDGITLMFDHWMKTLLANIGDDLGTEIDANTLLPPKHWLVIEKDHEKSGSSTGSTVVKSESALAPAACRVIDSTPNENSNYLYDNIRLAKLVTNRRMTSKDHFQDVRHVVLQPQVFENYEPGDTVALYPQNDPKDVDVLIKHQGWSDLADLACTIVNNDKMSPMHLENGLVEPMTLRNLLTYNLDIMSIPKRTFFDKVWHFSENNDMEKEKLREFSTLEGLEDLYDYANRPRRSILETILEFDSLRIPVEHVFELIPQLRPRLFSIASASNEQQIQLAIAIVKYKTIIKRVRRGVCTRWVEELSEGSMVPYRIVRNHLLRATSKKVNLLKAPLLMVGPGTGVAPMRSLIYSRLLADSTGGDVGRMVLFFGCRYAKKDYIFANDWQSPKDKGLLQVIEAFSREGGGYVQTQMINQAKMVSIMLVEQGAVVYVCGASGSMPRQVREAIVEILQQDLSWDSVKAEAFLSRMEKDGRYIQETW